MTTVPPQMPKERRALAVAVRELRARQAMSQEAVSDAAGLGRGFVTELESGRRRVSFEAVVAVSRGLGVPLGEVVKVFEERLRD
jgi:transcriptional regulator with XRE-family HTH domain